MENPESKLVKELKKLKEMGVTISIDKSPVGDGTYGRAVTDKIIEEAKKLGMYEESSKKTGTGYVVPVIVPNNIKDKD